MPLTSIIKTEFESWEQGRDHPYGISLGATRNGFIKTASGKSEMVKLPDSGKTRGNRSPEWKIQTGRSSNRK
jgi:hypothetical protein